MKTSWGHFGSCVYFSLLFIFLSPTLLTARPPCERLLSAVCTIVVMHCVGETACLGKKTKKKLLSKALIETKIIIKFYQRRQKAKHPWKRCVCNNFVLKSSHPYDVTAQPFPTHRRTHNGRCLCKNNFLLSRLNSTLDIPLCVWTMGRCGLLLDLHRGKLKQVSAAFLSNTDRKITSQARDEQRRSELYIQNLNQKSLTRLLPMWVDWKVSFLEVLVVWEDWGKTCSIVRTCLGFSRTCPKISFCHQFVVGWIYFLNHKINNNCSWHKKSIKIALPSNLIQVTHPDRMN